MKKFCDGSRVVVTNPNHYRSGQQGVVTYQRKSDGRYRVCFNDNRCRNMLPSDIKLVYTEVAALEPVPKMVNARCRVSNPELASHGKYGTISRYYPSSGTPVSASVTFDDGTGAKIRVTSLIIYKKIPDTLHYPIGTRVKITNPCLPNCGAVGEVLETKLYDSHLVSFFSGQVGVYSYKNMREFNEIEEDTKTKQSTQVPLELTPVDDAAVSASWPKVVAYTPVSRKYPSTPSCEEIIREYGDNAFKLTMIDSASELQEFLRRESATHGSIVGMIDSKPFLVRQDIVISGVTCIPA